MGQGGNGGGSGDWINHQSRWQRQSSRSLVTDGRLAGVSLACQGVGLHSLANE